MLPQRLVALLTMTVLTGGSFSLSGAEPVKEKKDAPWIKDYPASGWSLGGYGEMIINTNYYGPDPKQAYPSNYRDTTVDMTRVVFFAGYKFNDRISFFSETEFEHGGTGSTMEIEYEEFGEYEKEIEKGGEIVLEQAYIEILVSKYLGLKFGHLLVPIGMISNYHIPTMFSAVYRPESEEHLIPSTWHESGAELFARWKMLSVQFQVLSGLDSTGFSSQNWIGGGSQGRFEKAKANDIAYALRLEYSGITGLMFGVSGYTSGTVKNRPKQDIEGIDGRVFLYDAHLRYRLGPLEFRSQVMYGTLENADLISKKNRSLSNNLGVPRTPVAGAAYAYYFESALDLLSLFDSGPEYRLDIFARFDAYDTMWKSPEADGGYGDPLLETRVLTAGLNFFYHPRVVFKAEYLKRWKNKNNSWDKKQHEFNLALGFLI